jgi:meso-butanediol dehydrogenase/(S,S)-butanediol dehydrogenase/diacetyl reductase
MFMSQLANKVIFLTGGSMGIGFECAIRYAAEGAKILIMSNDKASLEQAITVLGNEHSMFLGDISNETDVKLAIEFALDKYGKIDVIHNNAGIANPSKPLHETTDLEWNKLFDTNLKGILYTTKYGLASLIKSKGCILNTSSLVGEIGQENHAAYAATKGAVNALTKSMAIDYSKYKIRVNAVSPAGVWTPMLREWGKAQQDPLKIEKYLDDIHLLGYCPEGDVIADACVFIVSDKARFITGHILPVSGGAELGYRRVD